MHKTWIFLMRANKCGIYREASWTLNVHRWFSVDMQNVPPIKIELSSSSSHSRPRPSTDLTNRTHISNPPYFFISMHAKKALYCLILCCIIHDNKTIYCVEIKSQIKSNAEAKTFHSGAEKQKATSQGLVTHISRRRKKTYKKKWEA